MAKSTKNRRASWGSLQYDSKTRTARIRYWAEGADGYRRRSKTFRNVTRKQAEEERAKLLLDHGDDAPCPTVAQVWERWVLPTYEQRVEQGEMSPQSLAVYRGAWRKHVEPWWANVPVDEVRTLSVQQWLMDGRTYNQALNGRKVLSAIMSRAVTYELVPANPMAAKYIMPSKSTAVERDKSICNLKQLGELWRFVHGKFYEAAFLLSAFGGCRPGESLGAMSDDVTFRESSGIQIACVPIVRQVSNRHGVTDRLKTLHSRRTVVIVGRAAVELSSIASRNAGTFMTSNGVGRHLNQDTLWRKWQDDIPEDIRIPFRNLRNSWQTYMRWELGLPPWLIEPMMGHVGEGITGQYYDRPQVDVFCETMTSAYLSNPYDADWTWLDGPI